MVNVENVTSAVIRILSIKAQNIKSYCDFFITDEKDYSSAELYSAIYASMNNGAEGLIYIPQIIFKGLAKVNNRLRNIISRLFDEYRCSSQFFQERYDWKPPVTFKEGIKKMVNWYKNNNKND